jgi:hypothetical protein
MWRVSTQFKEELRKDSHTVAFMAQVLDSYMRPVIGGTIYDPLTAKRVGTSQFENIIVDGSVDIDVDSDIQRSFTMTILNSNAEFSPDSQWAGLFYVNRIIRIWRGLVINGEPEWVPIGTFMIDHADVIVDRNISTVVLSGSDLWKKFAKSQFSTPGSFAADTTYNTIIKDIAADVGISADGELALDPLSDRASDDKRIQKKLAYERLDNRGEFLSALCRKAGIDIYFDPLGKLVTQDFRSSKDQAVVWKFYDADGGMLLSLNRSFNDDRVYNHLIVVGTGDSNTVYKAERKVDSTSPVSINKIGDRCKVIESKKWNTQTEVNNALKAYWEKFSYFDETLEIETICNPALEGNDVISVRETKFTDLGQEENLEGRKYRIKQMTIPLSSSRSKITMRGATAVDV